MSRRDFQMHLPNLDDVEHDLVATLVAVLTDPGCASERKALRAGELALVVDGDEVTWIAPHEMEVVA